MPHLVSTFNTNSPAATILMHATAVAEPPLGAGYTLDQVEQADKMEVWGSSFNDQGADYCDYKLFKDNKKIGTKRIAGY